MNADTTQAPPPHERAAGGRREAHSKRSKDPFVLLDLAYFRRIRPLLTAAESKVYEELVIQCDGWDRPTRAPEVAKATGLHTETVRKAIHELDRVGLVRRRWLGSPTSPHGLQRIEIVREYDGAVAVLGTSRRRREPERAQLPIPGLGDCQSPDWETPNPATGSHLIARSLSRSDPDPSLPSLPALPAPDGARGDGKEGGSEESSALSEQISDISSPPTGTNERGTEELAREWKHAPPAPGSKVGRNRVTEVRQEAVRTSAEIAAVGRSLREFPCPAAPSEPEARSPLGQGPTAQPALAPLARTTACVPNELVALVRLLWGTDVALKAARRYLAALLAIGTPPATTDEIARYLKSSARSSRVQRANFPISVACMPDEFADWLRRHREARMNSSATSRSPPVRAVGSALPLEELGRRAQQLCQQLAAAPKRAQSAL